MVHQRILLTKFGFAKYETRVQKAEEEEFDQITVYYRYWSILDQYEDTLICFMCNKSDDFQHDFIDYPMSNTCLDIF